MATQKAAEHLLMDALGLAGTVQIEAVLLDPRDAEVVEHAADRDDQRIVAEPAPRHDLGAARIRDRLEHDLAPGAIEAAHPPELEGKAVRAGVREVVEAVGVDPQRAGGDLVQQRLPHVDQRAIDQRHPGLAAPGEATAELGREHQAAGAAAHDHEVVQRCCTKQWRPARALAERSGSRSARAAR